MTENLCKY